MIKVEFATLGASEREDYCGKLQNQEYGKSILVLPNCTLIEEVEKKYNVCCMSMDTLARKILNQIKEYKEYDIINRRRQELLVGKLIEKHKDELAYFAAVLDKPGFVKAMTTLMSQLSRSGLTKEEVAGFLQCWEDSDPLQDKVIQVKAFYEHYLNTLESFRVNGRKVFDIEGQYRLAIEALREEKLELPWNKIYFSDFYTFDMLQLEFINKLGNHTGIELTICLPYEKGREAVFGAVTNTAAFLVGMEKTRGKADNFDYLKAEAKVNSSKEQMKDFREQIARNLWRESNEYSKLSTDNVILNAFTSRDEEMRWTLSKIKEMLRKTNTGEGQQEVIKPSDIVLAVRNLNNYVGLRQIADEYGVPVSLPKTMALVSHPVVEFTQLLLRAALPTKKGADAYFAALNCPWAKLFTQCNTEKLVSLREKKFYTSALDVRKDLPEDIARDTFVQDFHEYLDAINSRHTLREHYELLKEVFAKLAVEKTLGTLYKEQKLSLQSLQASVLAKNTLLRCACDLVSDYEACGYANYRYDAQEWAELVLAAVQNENIVLESGRQDGVKITDVINMRGLARPYVFILGMREHEFPAIENNEWIYNDLDRIEMIQYGIELPIKATQYSEDAWLFAAALIVAQKELYLSWHVDSEAGKSPYIEGVMQLFDNVVIGKGENKKPASLSEFERQGEMCDKQWLQDKLQEAAVITEAVKVDLLRNEKTTVANSYNGILAEQEVIEQAKNEVGNSFSATSLEKYAACPFQFLGERIWSKSEKGEQEEEVVPTVTGTLLHNTLASFVKTYLNKSITQNDITDLELRLHDIFETECAKLIDHGIVDNELWKIEKRRIEQKLRRWLKFECEDQEKWENYSPKAVEWKFGGQNADVPALELLLDDGSKVSLTGSIDRLDGDGDYVFITDYKQSSTPADGDIDKGLDMQMPIYMMAANKYFAGGSKISGDAYLSMRDDERYAALAFVKTGNKKIAVSDGMVWEKEKEKYERTVKEYIEEIYAGQFKVAPKKCSEYCRLKDICRKSLLRNVNQEVKGDE